MSWQIPVLPFTRVAAADLTGSQYLAVTLDASSELVLAGAGLTAIGVLQTNPDVGEEGTIEAIGITKMVAGATIAPGDRLELDASSRAIVATTGVVIGICIEGGAIGEIASVLLTSQSAV